MATNSKFSADLGLKTDADLQVDGNVTVSGNLTVNGTSTTVNSTTTSVEDSMLELANQNTSSDILDIGIYGNYDDGLGDGTSEYTGLFRDASDSTWKLFDGLEVEPTTTVNTSGSGYSLADIQVGDLTATTLTATNSLTGSSITYPTSDGTNGQVLTTNGSGTLSFTDMSSGADGITASGSNTIIQSPDDTNVIHVNNTSNVQIGSSTGSYTFAQKLIVGDGDSNDGITIQSGTTHQGNIAFNKGGGTTAEGRISYQHDSNYMSFLTNNAERMRISGDNVIIGGTEIPSTVLDGTGAAGALGIGNSSELYPAIAMMSSQKNWLVYQNSTGNFQIYDSDENKERFRIEGDGKTVFQNTLSADGHGFFVETGNSADTGIAFGRNGTDNLKTGIRSLSNGSSSYTAMKLSLGESSGSMTTSSPQFIFYHNGNFTATGSVSSDRRLKENIVDIPDGSTEFIKQLNPVSFNMIGSSVDKAGFIAQEVEAVKSSLVNGGEIDENGDEIMRGVDYYGILAHAVKTIQELEARITELESS